MGREGREGGGVESTPAANAGADSALLLMACNVAVRCGFIFCPLFTIVRQRAVIICS